MADGAGEEARGGLGEAVASEEAPGWRCVGGVALGRGVPVEGGAGEVVERRSGEGLAGGRERGGVAGVPGALHLLLFVGGGLDDGAGAVDGEAGGGDGEEGVEAGAAPEEGAEAGGEGGVADDLGLEEAADEELGRERGGWVVWIGAADALGEVVEPAGLGGGGDGGEGVDAAETEGLAARERVGDEAGDGGLGAGEEGV